MLRLFGDKIRRFYYDPPSKAKTKDENGNMILSPNKSYFLREETGFGGTESIFAHELSRVKTAFLDIDETNKVAHKIKPEYLPPMNVRIAKKQVLEDQGWECLVRQGIANETLDAFVSYLINECLPKYDFKHIALPPDGPLITQAKNIKVQKIEHFMQFVRQNCNIYRNSLDPSRIDYQEDGPGESSDDENDEQLLGTADGYENALKTSEQQQERVLPQHQEDPNGMVVLACTQSLEQQQQEESAHHGVGTMVQRMLEHLSESDDEDDEDDAESQVTSCSERQQHISSEESFNDNDNAEVAGDREEVEQSRAKQKHGEETQSSHRGVSTTMECMLEQEDDEDDAVFYDSSCSEYQDDGSEDSSDDDETMSVVSDDRDVVEQSGGYWLR